jgi:hypothetical protein
MDKLIELVSKGVITTRLVTLVLTGICGYMWIKGLPLDETLRTSWLIILGFWFNSEISSQVIKWVMDKKDE